MSLSAFLVLNIIHRKITTVTSAPPDSLQSQRAQQTQTEKRSEGLTPLKVTGGIRWEERKQRPSPHPLRPALTDCQAGRAAQPFLHAQLPPPAPPRRARRQPRSAGGAAGDRGCCRGPGVLPGAPAALPGPAPASLPPTHREKNVKSLHMVTSPLNSLA